MLPVGNKINLNASPISFFLSTINNYIYLLLILYYTYTVVVPTYNICLTKYRQFVVRALIFCSDR